MCLIIMLQTWYIIAQIHTCKQTFQNISSMSKNRYIACWLESNSFVWCFWGIGLMILSWSACVYECTIIFFYSFEKIKSSTFKLGQFLAKSEEVLCPFHGCSKAFKVNSTFTAHLSRKHHNMDVRSLSSACINQNTSRSNLVVAENRVRPQLGLEQEIAEHHEGHNKPLWW